MIGAIVGLVFAVGLVLGWYGYKANLRIARWGEAMWERDREAQLEDGAAVGDCANPDVVAAPGEPSATTQTTYAAPVAASR